MFRPPWLAAGDGTGVVAGTAAVGDGMAAAQAGAAGPAGDGEGTAALGWAVTPMDTPTVILTDIAIILTHIRTRILIPTLIEDHQRQDTSIASTRMDRPQTRIGRMICRPGLIESADAHLVVKRGRTGYSSMSDRTIAFL